MEKCINKNSLIASIELGGIVECLFFWGHQSKKDGSIGKSCLSQWYPAVFMLNNMVYQTAEHYMMAQKALLFNDYEIAQQILKTESAQDAKMLGRNIKNFDEKVWESHCLEIVLTGNMAKFAQNDKLKDFLLRTKGKVLVEASPNDQIWGIGMAVDNQDVKDPRKWKGLNLLGFILMKVRDDLR